MGYFSADHDVLFERSGALRDVGIDLREITQSVRMTAGRISRNPSLNKLQYPGMVREAGTVLESHAAKVEGLSNSLEQVATLYESYENKVISAPFSDVSPSEVESVDVKRNPFLSFLMGGWEGEGAIWPGEVMPFKLGVAATGAVYGEFFGWKGSLKPDAEWDLAEGDAFAGIKGELEGHVVNSRFTLDSESGHIGVDGKVLTGAVEGELGASIFRDGKFNPSLTAKGSGKVSAASLDVESRVGSETTNLHSEIKNDLFTAFAEGEVHVGADGLKAGYDVGAYAYKGEFSGGFSFMGLKVDVGAEVAAGGAGAEAGVRVGKSVVSGDLGLGLGIGGAIHFTIDASGVPKAIGDWWNSLFK